MEEAEVSLLPAPAQNLGTRDLSLVVAIVLPMGWWILTRLGVLPDPQLVLPISHFVIGTIVSVLAMLLAGLLVLAATQIADGRALFIGLAFLCLSGIFLVHALTTPGILVRTATPWVGLSSQLSLTSGAVLLGMSVGPAQSWLHRWVVRQRGWVIGGAISAVVIYGVLALSSALALGGLVTTDVHSHSGSSGSSVVIEKAPGGVAFFHLLTQLALVVVTNPAAFVMSAATLGLFLTATGRYLLRYRRQRDAFVWNMAVATSWLAGAQLALQFSPLWRLSWWSYHLMMLGALVVAVDGVNRASERHGTLGDVVAGLLVQGAVEQLTRSYNEVIAALCATVEAKDPYTRGHSARVAWLAAQIGTELGLPSRDVSRLYQAGLLHDIGKIGIPDAVLQKPGRLTPEEFALIKTHPVRGAEIVRHVRSLASILPAVRWHHERLDGSGYPDGLAGDEIPLDARIMAVADVFDALTSARPYRAAMSVEEAFTVLLRDAGTALDPDCVAALRRVIARSGWPHAFVVPAVEALQA